ncbi:MAG TPA: hypothetical protein VF509_10565 [Sphingobium sp.]
MIGRLAASRRTALWAASGAAFAVLTVPAGLIEMATTASGVSEVLPGAAPPLGLFARLLLAGFAGVMAAGATLAFRRQGMPAKGEEKMAFALSRLTGLAKRRAGKPEPLASDMPVLRRADAHPDAPARRPIFANSDFGGTGMFAEMPATSEAIASDVDAAFVEASEQAPEAIVEADEQLPLSDSFAVDAPVDPTPHLPLDSVAHDDSPSGFAPLAAPVPPPGIDAQPAALPREPRPPLDGLTIAQLAERFEHGLSRRAAAAPARAFEAPPVQIIPVSETAAAPRVIADIPPVPSVSVKPDVDTDVDEALRVALGTLQRMSAR